MSRTTEEIEQNADQVVDATLKVHPALVRGSTGNDVQAC